MPRPPEDIKNIRIPILGESTARAGDSSKDQRFVNGYFDVLKNQTTEKTYYYFCKRPGLTTLITPPGVAATARGMYVWQENIYTCYGTKLYKGTTDLGVTLTTSTGIVSMETTRPNALGAYLVVTDGTALYVIDSSDNVYVLNNVAITSSSVANPSIITTATAHNLNTGNRVIIRNHAGSSPSINDTAYTVTVLSPTTFSIPVNVTVGGTGGTLGVVPAPNLKELVYFDGFLFLSTSEGAIYNCELDNPFSWPTTNFITPIMDNGSPISIARQGNFLIAFGDKWTQGFFNAANATGSPLQNYEQMMQQVGCAGKNTITHEESFLMWVGSSELNGYTVYKLSGVAQLEDIGDPTLNRLILDEGLSLPDCRASLVRAGGHLFYVLTLVANNRTWVYDVTNKLWIEWSGTSGGKFPILLYDKYQNTTIAQHESNGKIYTMTPFSYQDDGTNFTVLARFSRLDLDTNDWKFVKSVELLGDKQTTSTPVLLQYSDDDYQTLSTARTFDMSDINPMGTNFGRFRRRAWQVSYTGNGPLRLEGLQMKFRLGTD